MGVLKCRVVGDEVLIVEFPRSNSLAVSTAPLTGGFREGVRYVVIRRVGESLNTDLAGLKELISESLRMAGVGWGDAVVVLTAADVRDYVAIDSGVVNASVAVVPGIKPPTCVDIESVYEPPKPFGTVSIVVGVDEELTDSAALDLLRTVVEVKSAVFADLLLRCESRCFGTPTDNVTIIYRGGVKGIPWAGPATVLGHEVGLMVRKALINYGLKSLSINDWLRNSIGLGINELVDLAMHAYSKAPVPGVPDSRVKGIIKGFIESMLRDPNIWSFIVAARELDLHAASGTLPGLTSEEFRCDSVRVVADELIGLALATYAAGSKAIFTTYWVERIKGGDLLRRISELPMFEDDVASAIIASALTKAYDELLGGLK